MKHAIIFKTLWRERKAELPSQKEIAQRLNWDESFFSRFLGGKQDVKTELFLQLVAMMPVDFQIEYWQRISQELHLVGLPPSPYCQEQENLSEVIEIITGLGIGVERLKELLNDIPRAVQANIPSIMMMNNFVSEMAELKLKKMITECIAEKTEEELREQIEFLRTQNMTWDIFQEIAQGTRMPESQIEVEELKALIDPPRPDVAEKYALLEWVYTFFLFNRTIKVLYFQS